MKKLSILFFLCMHTLSNYGQEKDSIPVNKSYWEDQLYLGVTYNKLIRKSVEFPENGFSYGLSLGYIKDIPFRIKGDWALGIGLGYNYEYFNHGLKIDANKNITTDFNVNRGKVNLQAIEMPIQIRWRDSDVYTYSFWRIYTGIRLSYNFYNSFKYNLNNKSYIFKNIQSYRKFQLGYEVSFGYGAFNLFLQYNLLPMYKTENNEDLLNVHTGKFGLIFYFL